MKTVLIVIVPYIKRSYFRVKYRERIDNRQNLANAQIHEDNKLIKNNKNLSIIPKLHTNSHYKIMNPKVHTGGKFCTHGPRRHKDNQLQSLELFCWSS